MIMMYTIILSFQIWFPFLDLRSLDNSKSLFGKRFDIRVLITSTDKKFWVQGGTGVLAVLYRKQKGMTRTDNATFPFLKNCLTGPGTFLLPFLPGFGLYLHLGFLLQLGVALPRHLLGHPQSSFSPLWPGATHFSS